MRWGRESEATFTADWIDSGGAHMAMTNVVAQLIDPNDVEVTTPAPTNPSVGVYSVVWPVPDDAPFGLWRIRWTATTVATEQTLGGDEVFEVVEAGYAALPTAVTQLRRLVGDGRISGMSDEDLFFTDDDLHSLWVKNAGNLNLAAAEGWIYKAAYFAEMIDVTESGAERRASQKFKNALTLADRFEKNAGADVAARTSAIRVVGRAINLRSDVMDPLGLSDAPYISTFGSGYVRTYPLKRFASILR